MTGPSTLPYPPRVTAFTRPFWDAVAEGRLSTTQCTACGFLTFPPKIVCPSCWSVDIAYVDLSGQGILRSYTEICVPPGPFRNEAPYVIALIDLDEEIRILSRIRASFDDLKPDARVRMVVRHAQPVSLFEFELEAEPTRIEEKPNA